ncbi:MAG: FtsW/RodA/SpoVE family cell cycle protein [Anaerolineales bacterium]
MGNAASIKRQKSKVDLFSINKRTAQRSLQLGIDVPLLLIVFTLLIFGLLMVYSASWDYSLMVLQREPTYMFFRQVGWMLIGVVVAGIFAFLNYHRWQKLSVPLMVFAVIALFSVLMVNEVINNAARTLWGGSVQPSEMAKLATVIYLAVWMFSKRDQLSDVSFGLIPLSAILGVVGGLIFIQPDLSAAITIFILGGILFFLGGGDLRQIAMMLILAMVVGWLVIRVHPTGSIRIAEYLRGLDDLTLAPYHLSRSIEALVKGGWFGVGIGLADTKLTGLPVPPTDSIFAVVAEETGIIGASSLVILYSLLMWRGLVIANRAPDWLGKLLAAGLSMWIAMEAIINMAVIVGLMPFAGNALPFISAGGSNLLVSMAAIGILMNISRLASQTQEQEKKSFDTVIDLRRRDGRRRVSRTGGASAAYLKR